MSLMLSCEEKLYGTWKEIAATKVSRGTKSPAIRCKHCHGAIRVHKSLDDKSRHQDHFEHRIRNDSKGCIGGVYHDPKSEHIMSSNPIK